MTEVRPATPADLFARLDALGIPHRTFKHAPVFTVEEAKALRGALPGAHTKNLFLKDKKDRLFLVVALEERRIDLTALSKRLGVGRFSFGNAELLMAVLGITPGSVTPFAAINDRERKVAVILDADMLKHDPVNYHPLSNDQTTAISPQDLVKFIQSCGHNPQILDFEGPVSRSI
jgi:Ala-tRNA(Pro) deacylase